ncbi:unnamed protein product [Acanthoscelides obtectus]|uniref:Uncharacterized protein n=1 Tax=Acanthoscelides obtectus TaxID=200917 RepID=A0A9P0M5B3_ACAOB|nr:unnamed protein product [Acanthoscelides obtectus]CAK1677856.1 Nuclear export mediator factor NEMF homolog [Acanthoscelides obtectus]
MIEGNIILTDYEFTISNILRPHTEGDKVKFVVREKYPQDRARETTAVTKEAMLEILHKAKSGDPLKKVLVPNLEYGPPLIEHVLVKHGFTNATKIGKHSIFWKILIDLWKLCKRLRIFFKLLKRNTQRYYF